jgi:hypothetical protein
LIALFEQSAGAHVLRSGRGARSVTIIEEPA